ncbi:hypothetical protein [Chelativorans sp. AA-79]|uniref:hypothetical protein n=1 Tax=Chelativorans sp. AA-79 TaxID=3028735 RepID=UPI0023F69872|nr:hypothetical protein [Chelativorans sp. AA-79]WEX07870.1 hypothetical protein PVE73_17450 [Chelativorans sp. AA-79]
MEAFVPILVQAISGVVAGEAVGAAFKKAAMSQLPIILSGIVGGVGGGALLSGMGGEAGALSGVLGHVVGGGAGGAILTGIVGAIMNSMKKA